MRLNKILASALIGAMAMALSMPSHAAKKPKLRMSAKYIKVMGEGSKVELKARAKGEDGMAAVPDAAIEVYQDTEDTSIMLGVVTTNSDGEGIFEFKISDLLKDTSGIFLLRFSAEGTETYRGSEKELEFMDSELTAVLEEDEDGMLQIVVQLTDVKTGEPAIEQPIFVGAERLFKPLPIGDDLYETDEDGSVYVPYEDSIPSIDGNIAILVRVEDSEIYGWVQTTLSAKIGAIATREDTFDQRTMWSPPSKTPWFLLIFPNLIILGVWSTLVYLVYNLYKIYKMN